MLVTVLLKKVTVLLNLLYIQIIPINKFTNNKQRGNVENPRLFRSSVTSQMSVVIRA